MSDILGLVASLTENKENNRSERRPQLARVPRTFVWLRITSNTFAAETNENGSNSAAVDIGNRVKRDIHEACDSVRRVAMKIRDNRAENDEVLGELLSACGGILRGISGVLDIQEKHFLATQAQIERVCNTKSPKEVYDMFLVREVREQTQCNRVRL